MATEDLMAAIQGGIETANTSNGMPATVTDDTGGNADEPNTDDAGDGTADGSGAPGTDDLGTNDGSADAPAADGTGDDADESGDDADESGKDGGKPAVAAKDKAGVEGAEKNAKPADGKPLTPEQLLDAPIDGRLKKDTQDRIRGVVAMAKTLTAERDTARQEAQELLQVVTDTGSTPEQYGQALQYLSLVNSGEPAQLEKALNFMLNEAAALAKMIGKPIPGVDFLAEHEDLRQAVVDGQMTEAHATELAAARSARTLQVRQSQNRTTQNQQTHQWNEAREKGKSDLAALEVSLRKTDPQYEAKKAILLEAMRETISRTPPDKWAATWKSAYDKLKIPTAAKPRTGVPQNQPLRGKTPAGGEVRTAGSTLDAVRMGIKMAAGG